MSNRFSPISIYGIQKDIEIPNHCPHCGLLQEISIHKTVEINNDYFAVLYKCCSSSCQKISLYIYQAGSKQALGRILYSHPRQWIAPVKPCLKELSPRFFDLYQQAANSEMSGDLDLAACGYRNAIEALVKDFAIRYFNVPADESLMRRSLQDCIGKYLSGLDEAVSAYMIKEFGNFAAHYPQLEQIFDYQRMKKYLDMFLMFMDYKVTVRNDAESFPERFLEKHSQTSE